MYIHNIHMYSTCIKYFMAYMWFLVVNPPICREGQGSTGARPGSLCMPSLKTMISTRVSGWGLELALGMVNWLVVWNIFYFPIYWE